MKTPSELLQEVINRACTGTVTAQSDGTVHRIFPVAIPPGEGERLREWVVQERAASTLEVGFGYGISTLFILQGLVTSAPDEGRHLAIDPNEVAGFSGIGLQLVAEAGLRDRLEFVSERSEIALPHLVEQGRHFDFAFVDGNHRFDAVFVDLVHLGRLVRPGAAIFLDDYQLAAVAKACAFFVKNRGWTIEDEGAADEKHRWVVLRTPASPEDHPFDYYVDF